VAVGALLACTNFSAVRFLVGASMRRQGGGRAALQLLLIAKMGLVFGAVALAMHYLPLSPIGLAVGVSVFLISIAIVSIRAMASAPEEVSPEPPREENGRA
jgi:hypothetical protein